MAASVFLPALRVGSTTEPRSQRRKDTFRIFESPLADDRSVSEHVIALAEPLAAPGCDHTVLADCEMTLRFGICRAGQPGLRHDHPGGRSGGVEALAGESCSICTPTRLETVTPL